ncbi:hypothetical protein MMMDOFMJ_3515 [Methylobacterium gnaphalii]|nr:hypothetical protein MMMDOFMJ_3515 [Methylobacterium gnaphalii]
MHVLMLACFILSTAGLQVQAAERRVALVIGNSAYRNAPVLSNPVRDALSVAEMFKKAGFTTVELKQDLESLELKRAIRAFLGITKDSEIAVVFFAGHGIEVNGANYIIPVDARLKTDFDAEDEGVALERIIRAVEPARRLRLIILDACRDNPFIPQMQRTVSLRGITAGLGKVEPAASDTLVAYAARAGSVADDGQTDHSPFTTALLKHLTTPGLDIRVALGRVRDDVVRDTGGKQEPFVYGSLGGSTVSLVPDKPAPAVSQADPGADGPRDYMLADRIGTRDAWNHFLRAHPTGFLADLARAQLQKLPGDPAPATATPADLAKAANKRPSAEPTPAIRMEARRHDPGKVEPEMAQVVPRSTCDRDRETLAMLRERQVAEKIAAFARDLTCEALRPQVTRLLESTGSADSAKPSLPAAAPKPAAGTPAIPVSLGTNRSAPNCEDESRALARLRAAPNLMAVETFEQNLTCKALQPQVSRLRESLHEN